MFSYSKVETYHSCPYKFYLRYIQKLEAKPDMSPNNALFLGSALHEGIEKRSVDEAIEKYKSYFEEITPAHDFEIEKLEQAVIKAINALPEGDYEYRLSDPDGFVGYIDMLVKVEDGIYDLYDFKYSNAVERYANSAQIHVYKYYYERITGNKIRNMYYVMVPKLMETLNESLDKEAKLNEYINNSEVILNKIDYDSKQIGYFFARKVMMEKDDKFIKRKNSLCKWCEYKAYCESNGEDRSELINES